MRVLVPISQLLAGVGCLATALLCCSSALAAEEPGVTPYRPTVSNPAALSAPGWLELEAGFAAQNGRDGSRQDSLPFLAKFAVTPDFGVLLGGNAFVSQREADGTRLSGAGDSMLMLKHRFVMNEDAALGCEYGFKAPTAAKGLGSGKSDLVLNGIYSRDIRGHALDINLNVTKLGGVAITESAYQYGWSGTVFRPFGGQWGVMAELSGVARRGALPENQWLLAASYAWSNRLVLDAGLSAGLGSTAHRAGLFAGMSLLLGQVR